MRMMRMGICAVLFVFLLTMTAAAQGEKKIGFLDLSRVFDSYERTKEYDKELEKRSAAYEKERNAKVDKLKEVQGKMALLKDEEKEKAQKEFENLREELLAYDQAQRADLGKERDEKIREILLEIEKIVSDFAKAESFDLIFNDRVLIYGNEAMDVTESILKVLNESFNKKQP